MEFVHWLSDYSLEPDLTEFGYEEAAVASNPDLLWIKFVFTDDQPNANNRRIPKEEFSNIVKTGVYMPIKMEEGNPDGQHALSSVIGVITNLKEQGNKVLGLAALWKREREDDVRLLEEAYKAGKPLRLSWEVLYEDAAEDENGIVTLKGTRVRAITFVGNPAYGNRTKVISMSQVVSFDEILKKLKVNKELTSDEISVFKNISKQLEIPAELSEKVLTDQTLTEDDLDMLSGFVQENSTKEEAKKLDELEKTKKNLEELQKTNEDLKNQLAEIKMQLEEKIKNLEELSSERDALKAWKEEQEAEAQRIEKLNARKQALLEAGLTEEEFEERSEKIMSMDEETFEFYAQELATFAAKRLEEEKSEKKGRRPSIPDVSHNSLENPFEIIRDYLEDSKEKNEETE